jgi:hypothetical protein
MAQTKRKRRTKHRGNAAGVVEVRGRTGRKPTESERKSSGTTSGRARRANRFDHPPTWRGAFNRALVATALFAAVVVFALKQPILPVLSLIAFMLVVYVPLGYYTDLWLYRRRARRKAEGKPVR